MPVHAGDTGEPTLTPQAPNDRRPPTPKEAPSTLSELVNPATDGMIWDSMGFYGRQWNREAPVMVPGRAMTLPQG
ncbi:hypothetical protein CHELA40_15373 [Chelatococcus asaccharovorans]|nr:hypothetical protein CHELA17_60244 [Chelatococcus asaccharovorans]CAH1682321.1 hypothetical protein CHELA40_15373 [Chelatococcus asaccharovorans]